MKFVNISLQTLLAIVALSVCTESVAAESSNVSYPDVLSLTSPQPSQTLRYGEDPNQFAELWLPTGGEKAPVVVFVHGGCWLQDYDIAHTRPLTYALSQLGYAVYSIEYRRLGQPGGDWPGSINDVSAAIGHLAALQHPEIDTQRVILTGHSAGGHLALLAAQNAASFGGVEVIKTIGLAAITDLQTYASGSNGCQQAGAKLMATNQNAAVEGKVHSERLPMPVVLLKGSADTIVPPDQTLAAQTSVTVDGAGHFDFVHPDTQAFVQLIRSLENALP